MQIDFEVFQGNSSVANGTLSSSCWYSRHPVGDYISLAPSFHTLPDISSFLCGCRPSVECEICRVRMWRKIWEGSLRHFITFSSSCIYRISSMLCVLCVLYKTKDKNETKIKNSSIVYLTAIEYKTKTKQKLETLALYTRLKTLNWDACFTVKIRDSEHWKFCKKLELPFLLGIPL